jgi:2-keto-4-pentenoate hydratase
VTLDPRIAAGTARMLALRAAAVSAGAAPLGWKLGFGSPAALAAFGTDRPLVGFLTRDRLLASGSSVSVAGWARPLLEAEVAVHLGRSMSASATASEALGAVVGWSVAIELADLDAPPTDIELVLAGNIFHRHVLLGPAVSSLPSDLSFSVLRDGVSVASTATPLELTGSLGAILASTASTLAACGASLAAGEVVITGSVVPPIDVSVGGSWEVVASGLGEVGVRLTAGRAPAIGG